MTLCNAIERVILFVEESFKYLGFVKAPELCLPSTIDDLSAQRAMLQKTLLQERSFIR